MTSPAQKPFGNSSLLLACSAFALAVSAQATALAKDEKSETAPSTEALEGNVSDFTETDPIDEIVVQSTRRDQTINEVSRSVRVFSDDDIAKFLQQTTSVQEILGRVIPGFAPPVTEGSAGSLTLRGREPLYLIDGVPVAPNTNFSRFLDRFDPLTIGKVEVVYGPTSLYGAGATGGVIQFFTQEPGDEPLSFGVGGQLRSFVTDDGAFSGDSTSTKVNASVKGKVSERLSIYAYASYEDINGVRRAEGDLLTGRSQFAEDITLFGKVKAQLDENQTLTATVNYTQLQPSDRFFELGRQTAEDGTEIAVEAPFAFSYAQSPTNDFIYTSLAYRHDDFFNGSLSALFYYSDSKFLNPGSDIRALLIRNGGSFPDQWPGLWQTGRENEEYGFRGQYVRDVTDSISISVGSDYNSADNTSLLPISTEDGFDDTLFFDGAIQAQQTPPFTIDALGLFVEIGADVTDRLTLTGGIRWDRFDYEVTGPYEVVFAFPANQFGTRPGGSGDADGFSYNIGFTYDAFDTVTLFANYSQGLTIPELGFIGNNVAPGVPVSDSDLVDPVITDSFEAGIRGSIDRLRFSLAGYYTESDFSTTVSVDPGTGLAIRDRAPVEIYGLEASLGWNITDRFSVDGFITWVDGEIDPNDDGNFIALSTQDIPPISFTLNPRFQATSELAFFGQFYFVGDRSDGFDAGTDLNPAESYALVDLGASFAFDDRTFGGGVLSLQVTNALNESYIPAGEATFIPGRIFSGPGRSVTLSYQHQF